LQYARRSPPGGTLDSRGEGSRRNAARRRRHRFRSPRDLSR
jgi:hypothetical protein